MKLVLMILLSYPILSYSEKKFSAYEYPGEPKDNSYLGILTKSGCFDDSNYFTSGLFTQEEIGFLSNYNPYKRPQKNRPEGLTHILESEGTPGGKVVQRVKLGRCNAILSSKEINLKNTKPLNFPSASDSPICKPKDNPNQNECHDWYKDTKSEIEKRLNLEDKTKRPIAINIKASTEPISDLTFTYMRKKHCKRGSGIFYKVDICPKLKRNERCFKSFLLSKASEKCIHRIKSLKGEYLQKLRSLRSSAMKRVFIENLMKENEQRAKRNLEPKYIFLKNKDQIKKRKEGAKEIIIHKIDKAKSLQDFASSQPYVKQDIDTLSKDIETCVKKHKLDESEYRRRFEKAAPSFELLGQQGEKDYKIKKECDEHFLFGGQKNTNCFELFKSRLLAKKITEDKSCIPGIKDANSDRLSPIFKILYNSSVIQKVSKRPIMMGEAFTFEPNENDFPDKKQKQKVAQMSLRRLKVDDIKLEGQTTRVAREVRANEEKSCKITRDKSVSVEKLSPRNRGILTKLKAKLTAPEFASKLSRYHLSKNSLGEINATDSRNQNLINRCRQFKQQNAEGKFDREIKSFIEAKIAKDFIHSQFGKTSTHSCDLTGNGKTVEWKIEKGTFGDIYFSSGIPAHKNRKYKNITCNNFNSVKDTRTSDKIDDFNLFNPLTWNATVLSFSDQNKLKCECTDNSNTNRPCSATDALNQVAAFYESPPGKSILRASLISEEELDDQNVFEDETVVGTLNGLTPLVARLDKCENRRKRFKVKYDTIVDQSRRQRIKRSLRDIPVPLLMDDDDETGER